jgi:hypothetical protein
VRNRLNKQRDHLFTFLDHDGVDATNKLAERRLRPAVIARKISPGNKTRKGARTWQILTSLAATCSQCVTSFIAALASENWGTYTDAESRLTRRWKNIYKTLNLWWVRAAYEEQSEGWYSGKGAK